METLAINTASKEAVIPLPFFFFPSLVNIVASGGNVRAHTKFSLHGYFFS